MAVPTPKAGGTWVPTPGGSLGTGVSGGGWSFVPNAPKKSGFTPNPSNYAPSQQSAQQVRSEYWNPNNNPGQGGQGTMGNFGGQSPPMPAYRPQPQQQLAPQGSYAPQMQNQQQPAQFNPHLTTSIQRRGVMDQAPLLAGANQQAQQFSANNAVGGAGVNQLLQDNLQSQMLNRGVEFDRMAGAANARHSLGTQTAAANDIVSKGGLAQDQMAQQYRNEAFQRNLMLQMLGMV